MPSRSRTQLEDWLKTIDVHGHVLDIGGSQKSLRDRTKTFRAVDYIILDLENPHERRETVNITTDIQEKLEDSPQIDYYNRYFDQVFCLEVSEYWHDPVQALKNINKFLKSGGELYISFHFTYGLHNPRGEDCLRYTEHAVQKLLTKAGFEDIEMTVKKHGDLGMEALSDFYKAEGMKTTGPALYYEGFLAKAIKI